MRIWLYWKKTLNRSGRLCFPPSHQGNPIPYPNSHRLRLQRVMLMTRMPMKGIAGNRFIFSLIETWPSAMLYILIKASTCCWLVSWRKKSRPPMFSIVTNGIGKIRCFFTTQFFGKCVFKIHFHFRSHWLARFSKNKYECIEKLIPITLYIQSWTASPHKSSHQITAWTRYRSSPCVFCWRVLAHPHKKRRCRKIRSLKAMVSESSAS